jgi:hypothetical protein
MDLPAAAIESRLSGGHLASSDPIATVSDVSAINSYLAEVEAIRKRGNATEHTYRPALKQLLEAIVPGITATNEPSREVCGAPDYSITADSNEGLQTIGYVEAKDVGISLDAAEQSKQLTRYRDALDNLLLTDYLEFRWYSQGSLRAVARFANVTKTKLARLPADDGLALLRGFLAQNPSRVSSAKDLAERLAKLAHLIRDVVVAAFESKTASHALADLRVAFAKALLPGFEKEGKTAEFCDMYAQTLAYGLFAARCNHRHGPFHRSLAASAIPKTNPFLRQLFSSITGTEMEDEPHVGLVDDLVALLDRTEIDSILRDFGARHGRQDPVIHFYETFLSSYDPALRELRGVYYTPTPVVSFIVRSVDWILQTSFGLTNGLADTSRVTQSASHAQPNATDHGNTPRVLVLDPACGTGTFLYSVVDHIRDRFMAKKNAGKWSAYVRDHLLPRTLGFELLMAPYAVAHLKLAMQLSAQDLPSDLREMWEYDFASGDRLGVYLTNTLEDAEKQIATLYGPLRVITEEANAAARIKRELPIMVVIGNPPYSGHSANDNPWISKLIESYKSIDGQRLQLGQSKWLQNDYVKFVRFSEHRIAQTGHGVMALITDHSYLTSGTFVGMRAHLARSFDELYILDLQGNHKLNKNRPDLDENIFDITQGVAIIIGIRRASRNQSTTVRVARIRGRREYKYESLSSLRVDSIPWETPHFGAPYFLLASTASSHLNEYEQYVSVLNWFPGVRKSKRAKRIGTGLVSTHDEFAISFSPDEAIAKVKRLTATASEAEARESFALCQQSQWNYARAKAALKKSELQKSVRAITYRPFDQRYTIWNSHVCVHRREEVHRHVLAGGMALLVGAAGNVIGSDTWSLAFVTDAPVDFNVFYRGGAGVLPLFLASGQGADGLYHGQGVRSNIPDELQATLEARLQLSFTNERVGDLVKTFGTLDVAAYVYAVMFSGSYRSRYSAMLDLDYPRIPLPSSRNLFSDLVRCGAGLIGLHLRKREDLKVSTAFPIKGSNVVEAGFPKYVAPGGGIESAVPDAGSGRVYINAGGNEDRAAQYFDGVAPEAWAYTIGGYQVCLKWLKDRRAKDYGSPLRFEDIDSYQLLVALVSASLDVEREIDKVIEAHGGWPKAFLPD